MTNSSSPFKTTSAFIPAGNRHNYLSYDKVPLQVGMEVYQVAFTTGNALPILMKFSIEEKLGDGRIKIKNQIDNNVIINMVNPNQVHTNALALVQEWYVIAKHQYEVELPAKINSFITILKQLNPNWSPENVLVGTGLLETDI